MTEPSSDIEQRARRFRRILLRWARSGLRNYPWRDSDDRFRVLIAEMMLTRTRPDQVEPIYERFLDRFPDASAVADADEATVSAELYSLGLEWRARRIHETAQVLSTEYGGKVPADAWDLQALPGVGPYVAAMVSALTGGKSMAAVDANVARIMVRVFGLSPSGEARRDRLVLEMAGACHSRRNPRTYSLAIVDFGDAICRHNPKCDICPVGRAGVCSYYKESQES